MLGLCRVTSSLFRKTPSSRPLSGWSFLLKKNNLVWKPKHNLFELLIFSMLLSLIHLVQFLTFRLWIYYYLFSVIFLGEFLWDNDINVVQPVTVDKFGVHSTRSRPIMSSVEHRSEPLVIVRLYQTKSFNWKITNICSTI